MKIKVDVLDQQVNDKSANSVEIDKLLYSTDRSKAVHKFTKQQKRVISEVLTRAYKILHNNFPQFKNPKDRMDKLSLLLSEYTEGKPWKNNEKFVKHVTPYITSIIESQISFIENSTKVALGRDLGKTES